ncbi:DNA-directed RNA polymerase III subunit, putative, partial [Trypanosoma cruzi marinkellei]
MSYLLNSFSLFYFLCGHTPFSFFFFCIVEYQTSCVIIPHVWCLTGGWLVC